MNANDDIVTSGRTPAVVLCVVALAMFASSWGYLVDGGAPFGDDNSAHLALMMHIADLWRAGVTDLWWNQSNLGLPLFMAYQPLPALLTGSIAAFFSETAARITLFKGSIVTLWALMPAAWYVGGRWLGLNRGASLVFGLLTLAIRDVHHVGFGMTAVTYGGLYTQLWGMALLPVTVGAFHRYVVDRELSRVVPIALFILLSLSHLFCGMYAGIATAIWLLVGRERLEQGRRALLVWVPALALLAFWLGPLLATSELVGGLPWPSEYYDGWPLPELLEHLIRGDVFDEGRLPWLTALVAVGLVVTVHQRSEEGDDWLLGLSGLTVVLWMGRTNFGAWYDLLPMHAHINVMRYINGVHFCGLILAAVAVERLVAWLRTEGASRVGARRAAIGTALVALLVGGIYSWDRCRAWSDTLETFDHRSEPVRRLTDHLSKNPDQRFAVSDDLNTGPHFYRDLLPALAGRGQLQSYALGYHATLSTYYADYIRYDPAWCRLFNVGAFVARHPYNRVLVDGFAQTFSAGPYRVFVVPGAQGWGYFDFVRTPVTVRGDFHDIRPAVRSLLTTGFRHRALPLLTDGDGPPVISAPKGESVTWNQARVRRWGTFLESRAPSTTVSSRVLSSSRGENWYAARVDAAGAPDRLMLKVNYFPFWRATVDGKHVSIEHVAPNFMVVDVPQGEHDVRFEYRNPWWQKLGFALCVVFLLTAPGLAVLRDGTKD